MNKIATSGEENVVLFLFVVYFIFVGSFNFGVDPAQKRDNLIGACRVSRVAGRGSRVKCRGSETF